MMKCVVSIKGFILKFKGGTSKSWGGATYLSNRAADFGANDGINYYSDVSQNFNNLVPG